MITFWAPGRRFSDTHYVALRYASLELAEERMRNPNFPIDMHIATTRCDSCNAYHIIRLSTLPLTINS